MPAEGEAVAVKASAAGTKHDESKTNVLDPIDTNSTAMTTTVAPLPLQQQVSHHTSATTTANAMNEQAMLIAEHAKTIKKQAKTIAKQERLLAQYKSFMRFVGSAKMVRKHGNCTPLQYAIQRKQFHVASSLIAAAGDDDLSVQDEYGWDALHFAVDVGALKIARLLLAKVGSRDVFRGFPTSHLISAESVDMVRVLLLGASVDVLAGHGDENGWSALHHFARLVGNGYLKRAQCLVEACPAMLFKKGPSDNTPLHFAAEKGNLAMIAYLAEQGGPKLVNATDAKGRTALYIGIEVHRSDVVHLLLGTFHADLLVANDKGRTVLHAAIATHQFDVAQYLLQQSREKGVAEALVNASFVDSKRTALHFLVNVAFPEDNPGVAREMVQIAGAQLVYVQDDNGSTALHSAARNDLFDLTRVLVQEGGGDELVHSVVDNQGKSVLRCLIDDNNMRMIRYLIEECGVNRHYACNANAGRTMLHDACEFGSLKLVRYLIPPMENMNHGPNDVDANVVALSNTADQMGTTPLHCAIVSNIDSWAKTRYLVDMAGADTKAIDANGNNAIELAGTKRNVPVLYFLLLVYFPGLLEIKALAHP